MNIPIQTEKMPPLPSGHLIRPEQCQKCAYATPRRGEPTLECRAEPPTAAHHMVPGRNGQPGFITYTGFPVVNPDSWCGRFKLKIAI